MTDILSSVRWGSYKEYEGPLHYGVARLNLQSFPTEGHVLLDVVTQTEGGSASAVNAYDRCIISVGLLQWCEANYFLSSALLGAIAGSSPQLMDPLQAMLNQFGAEFKLKAAGKWRFFIGSNEVDSADEQHALFFGGASGRRGEWSSEQQQIARAWVAAWVTTLCQPAAVDVQVAFTAKRMYGFATAPAKAILFEDGQALAGWPGAVQAGFLSFAANLPKVASDHLQRAVQSTHAVKWSPDWCIHVLKELTFGPKIAIYPHRYEKIRPKLEQHFGVNLPDFANELKAWQADLNQEVDAPSPGAEPSFESVEEVQRLLVDLGYDLGASGPKSDGVDGREGKRTRDALSTFQRLNGLPGDGRVDKLTRQKLLETFRSR